MPPVVGLIVNPIAGLGGRAGLKGTDGPDAVARALAAGAVPVSGTRAALCVERLAAQTEAEWLVAPGPMGADLLAAAGRPAHVVGAETRGAAVTSADDTRRAAAAMAAAGVDLLLFAGGDGTARAVHDAVGDAITVLGIPTGVKMHSGVFAASPADAADVAAAFLGGRRATTRAEVADADEEALRAGRLSTRLYGQLITPRAPARVLAAKAAFPTSDTAVRGAAAEIAEELGDGRVHLIAPGTTTQLVLDALGLRGTLLGVDAVQDGRLVGTDLDERGLLALNATGTLVCGVVGGQGVLLGRGDHQLSPAVIDRLAGITAIASEAKLVALGIAPLRVDTGDDELDRRLVGFLPVRVSRRRSVIKRVAAAPRPGASP